MMAHWVRTINDLKKCCLERSCLRNFVDIPQRVLTLPWETLYFEPDSPCCNLPKRDDVDDDYLGDIEEDYANDLIPLGFRAVWPGNTPVVQCFVGVKKRQFQHVDHQAYRRNLVNAVFFIPSKNSYCHMHQIYRYSPQNVEVEVLLQRILREAIPLLINEANRPDLLGHFCVCDSDTESDTDTAEDTESN